MSSLGIFSHLHLNIPDSKSKELIVFLSKQSEISEFQHPFPKTYRHFLCCRRAGFNSRPTRFGTSSLAAREFELGRVLKRVGRLCQIVFIDGEEQINYQSIWKPNKKISARIRFWCFPWSSRDIKALALPQQILAPACQLAFYFSTLFQLLAICCSRPSLPSSLLSCSPKARLLL